ncbi:Ig-like domain-containing protein [Kitasatospora sp. NBC_01266]|uniref:Ig-like domain-containing protein n=1 Tax=Kitasatospora sp. NBC_01266 TaxID=2903572 RepID=UPI002E30ACA8|nr:Ig-like domain-containing protein [Kitasatospora sp. NBC_01266]
MPARSTRRTVLVAAALAVGLAVGWLPSISQAQQSPDAWSQDRRAVLRSGLTVDLDFAAVPGITARPAPGTLDGAGAAGYVDGIRPGAPAETLRLSEDRPQVDGSWRTLGTLRLSFSRPVRNPRLHVSGLAGVADGPGGRVSSAVRLSVTGGSPAAPALTTRSPWQGWTAVGGALAPSTADGSGGAAVDPAGSLELDGTFDTATFRVERRDTAAPGTTTAPPALSQAFTVTLDETLGSAPPGYGNASHVISDLFLGSDAISAVPTAGLSHRGGGPQPAPPELQPGRVEHLANDPSVVFPANAPIGGYYDVTVPVDPGRNGATLAGWIDFDRDGHFGATERAQADVPPGASSATLEWIVPPDVTAGDTWARLRIARDSAQVVGADGFADAGEVEDQAIRLAVGVAEPELTSPVPGTEVGDSRPEFAGGSGVPGATVDVQEGTVTLCQAVVARDGGWSCRADAALAQGAHTVRPAETTSGGVVQTGEPVRITISTTPPAAPVLTLPEYTNDPGLLMTGTGGPGSTVYVTDGDGSGDGEELCRTAVKADRSWVCLPVEELAEGSHRLTATAVDEAGNHAVGRPTRLVVDTVPPAKPVLTVPGPGEELHVLRPRLAGKGEPGTTVTVVAGGDGALCAAVAAVDGSWTCNAMRDLAVGEQLLTPTATDRAGNATAGDAVRVRVVPAVPVSPTASASASASVSTSPSPSVSVSPSASASTSPSASPSPSVSASPSASASTSLSASPSPSVSASTKPTVGPSAGVGASSSPSAGVSAGAGPTQSAKASPSVTASVSARPSGSAGPSMSLSPGAVASTAADPIPSSSPPGAVQALAPVPKLSPSSPLPSSSAQLVDLSTSASPSVLLLAPPPAADSSVLRRGNLGGWQAAGCGALLILAGVTLIISRIFARGPGARRR